MVSKFRYVLIPFSIIYGGILWVRNRLFDKKVLRSASFNFPLICVGNLAVGGTGKTPMVEYLIRILETKYKVATLSRGYKRRTKGFALADGNTTAVDIGDEPMQIHLKFPGITVAVAEERVVGIPQLLYAQPDTGVILMDDAFQHRVVKAGLNILLTRYRNLYTRDIPLPAGRLRDVPGSSKRAQMIVVTKCPSGLEEDTRQAIIRELNPLPYQKVFFTQIVYGALYHLFTKAIFTPEADGSVLLICGIANPQPLKEAVKERARDFELLSYNDHHMFSSFDLKEIKRRFAGIKNEKKMILTTEKDAVRLAKFEKELEHLPVYVLPMEHHFLFGQEASFEKEVIDFVNSFHHL